MFGFDFRQAQPVSFIHVPSWAGFITITVGFRVFGTHTRGLSVQNELDKGK
jgi:hypothetical protein